MSPETNNSKKFYASGYEFTPEEDEIFHPPVVAPTAWDHLAPYAEARDLIRNGEVVPITKDPEGRADAFFRAFGQVTTRSKNTDQ